MAGDFEMEFAPQSGELAGLREHTRATLARWGFDGLADVACLLVSELASNAIAHVQAPARLRLTYDGTVHIAVTDTDPTPPVPRQPSLGSARGGRGLWVVDQLADHWDIAHHTDGRKTVSCQLSPHSLAHGE